MSELSNIFQKSGIELTEQQILDFEKFLKIFQEKNSQINLSAIRDEDGLYAKHFADSLLATKFFDFSGKNNILDLGSGGGFPTIPLAICFPDSTFTALDSVGKKMKAVADMANQLGLKNVKTVHDRIEVAGQNEKFRENFDIVVARALAPWPVLLEYALPFVKKGGKFIAYQGPSIEPDLEKFQDVETRLGGELVHIMADQIDGDERILVGIEKIKNTPKKYPRANGEPRMNPLK